MNNGKGLLLSKMLLLATTKHHDSYDKGGKPYILHPLKVMHYLNSEDEELMCIALGHDLIEDTDVTYIDLKNQGFTDRIINGIKCLTKLPGETREEYLEKIKSNVDSLEVKLCDIRHNSDIRRLKGLTDKDFNRLKRYTEDYNLLLSYKKTLGL